MIDEQIRDGDFVIVEDRKTAENGEMVIALIGGADVTLKKFYRENGRVRLQARIKQRRIRSALQWPDRSSW